MRIIAGKAGSLRLQVPPSVTRPTTDRVREALFSSLGPRVAGAAILDLFAGSGALGLEALSRGADSAVFVDSDAGAAAAITRNLETTRLEGGTVRRSDALRFVSTLPPGRFDLVFADPPYAREEATRELLEGLLAEPALPASLREGGSLVLESWTGASLPISDLWTVAKEKKYGHTRISHLIPAP